MVNLKDKKVLVTGGGGFLGAHICAELINKGARVTVLDVMPVEKLHRIAHLKARLNITTGSVIDAKLVSQTIKGMDAVVDASFPAAGCDRNLENQHIDVGTVGVFNLLKAALQHGACFIFASSISVYGVQRYTPIDERHPLDPVLLYGATKLAGEHYCRVMTRQYGCPVMVLRFSDLYGPGDGRKCATLNFLDSAMRGESLRVAGDGQQVRSYLYISDAARAVVLALENFKPGGIYNITGLQPLSILELAETTRRVVGARVPVTFIMDSPVDRRNYIIDGSRAEQEIGFKPLVGMEEGLALTLSWLKERMGIV